MHTAENALRVVEAARPWLAAGADSAGADTSRHRSGTESAALAHGAGPATQAHGAAPGTSPHGGAPSLRRTIAVPVSARAVARERLASAGTRAEEVGPTGAAPGGGRPLIGLHASGGRAIKQWPPERFGEAVGRLAQEAGAAVLLTGAPADRALVDRARAALPPGLPVVDAVGEADLVTLAALLERCAVYVTGDTGPMHLAAAVGTPVVAVFGPSEERRYAPLVHARRIVRREDDMPCMPCNRIRRPPARCTGHTPACLDGIAADQVYRAARELWDVTVAAAALDGEAPPITTPPWSSGPVGNPGAADEQVARREPPASPAARGTSRGLESPGPSRDGDPA
jgi:hypothetical protein